MNIKSFIPPKRILMGPGPSDVPESVSLAMAHPTIGHLDPMFVLMMDEIKSLLQFSFQTKNELTIPISAPGSAGMETCFANLLEPGEKVLVCINGVFGMRMKENVIRMGGEAIIVEDDWGQAVSIEKVQAELKKHSDIKILAFVHAETSTGVRSDVEALCKLAKEYNCLTIVDAVTSLAGIELKVDEWGIDAVYSGTQKCLSCAPGISPVSFSEAAVKKIKSRKKIVQSWFLDLNLVMGYWGEGSKRSYHHTAPVNALYGLHEALVLLQNEGLENAWHRHAYHHQAFKAGLESLGIEFSVAENIRLPQLNAVKIPNTADDVLVRKQLLENYNLEIGAGLGAGAGKLWRIGLMGYSAKKENVELCVSALADILYGESEKEKALSAIAKAYQ